VAGGCRALAFGVDWVVSSGLSNGRDGTSASSALTFDSKLGHLMPPIQINRRRFLGASAAAGWALSQAVSEGSEPSKPVRVGVVGLGTRGTALLRALLELDGVRVVALADLEPRHRDRGCGIVEKATGQRPDSTDRISSLVDRADVDAVAVALPCDLHASAYRDVIRSGKHLYGEKPLAATLIECDQVILEAARHPSLAVHVGYQRRSNPRFRDLIALVGRDELGTLVSGSATWNSSNGPMNGHGGWLGSRARSGDWMVEQAVHVWDVFAWLKGGVPPTRAFGHGRRDLFAATQPNRDVTDDYAVQIEWLDGFRVSFAQTWVAPADDAHTGTTHRVLGEKGALDFANGSVTFRDKGKPRVTLHPGPQPDTRLALENFVAAIRADRPTAPPVGLIEARTATGVGLLARKAVDERRVVTWDEIESEA